MVVLTRIYCPRCNGQMSQETDYDLRRPVPYCLSCGYRDYGRSEMGPQLAKPATNGITPKEQAIVPKRAAEMTVTMPSTPKIVPVAAVDHAVTEYANAAQAYLDLRDHLTEAEALARLLREQLDAAKVDLVARRKALDERLFRVGDPEPEPVASVPEHRRYGEGSIYQRSDGRWALAISVGTDAKGHQVRRYVYTKTREDAERRLAEMRGEAKPKRAMTPARLATIQKMREAKAAKRAAEKTAVAESA